MNWPRLILRAVFLVLIVWSLVYLTIKSDKGVQTIAEFKLEQLEHLREDSLNAEHKFERLLKDTKQFNTQVIKESGHVKKGIRYLTIVLGFLAASEIFFVVRARKLKGKE